jgi:hypothetical protein
MIRILKDCVLCGVRVHAGETFPIVDIPESDLHIVIGAGFAEQFTPEVKTPESASEDLVTADTDNEPPKTETAPKKAKKRKNKA